MTLEKAMKSVEACGSKLLLRLGPYAFSYENGVILDAKGRQANLSTDEIQNGKLKMTRMQMQGNAVLNALNEGTVTTVIRLLETGIIGSDPAKSRRENIVNVLTNVERGCGIDLAEANYWMEFFHIS